MMADPLIELMAQCEQRCREAVVYPAAARRAQQEAELRLLRRQRASAGDGAGMVRRLAGRLARLGAWGGRPAAPSHS